MRPGLFPIEKTGIDTAPLVDAARAFLDSLDDASRSKACLPIGSEHWRTWCNVHIYMWRHGVLLEDLSPSQRDAGLALIRSSLSARGFADVRDLMRCNEFLAEITNSPDEYGEWAYFLTIFGTPSNDEPWGWQLDGHHINLHCFVLGDQMVLTPAFLGAEPCHIKTGQLTGLRVFEAEERNGLAMVRSLSDDQAQEGDPVFVDPPRRRPARTRCPHRRPDAGGRVPRQPASRVRRPPRRRDVRRAAPPPH